MKQSTKRFKEWFFESKFFGVTYPCGVSTDKFHEALKIAHKAGYEQGLNDKEQSNDQRRS